MKIQTTQEMKKLIEECKTKSILEEDLTRLEYQLSQIQENISLVKLALINPETEEEYKRRETMKICNNCNFRIPDDELKMFGGCGQCGKNDWREQ